MFQMSTPPNMWSLPFRTVTLTWKIMDESFVFCVASFHVLTALPFAAGDRLLAQVTFFR